jgi:hypothetical protein
MNGRIRQLCQQKANYWMNHYDRKSLADMSLLYNDVEKFAELIVRECAKVVEKEMDYDANWCDDKILKHFGVDND